VPANINAEEAVWEGNGVKVGAIEAQLQRLWNSPDGAWSGEGRRPDIRTSVLNLVIYARDDDVARQLSDDIDKLAGGHPSRTIMLSPGRPHGEDLVDAHVAITTRGAYAEYKQVCAEQIVLKVHGQAAHHIDSVVLPLLAPDLPVFVWWPGETPFRQHAFVQLRDAANRFIVDSQDFARDEMELVEMAQAVRLAQDHCAFTDFNWSRLAPWREAIAAFFNPPESRPHLDTLTHVQLECDPEHGGLSKPQALLLAGWLAARLGWRPTDRSLQSNKLRFNTTGPKHAVSLELVFHEAGAKGRDVPLAKLNGPDATFALHRDRRRGPVSATSHVNGQQVMSRRVDIAEPDTVQLLFGELETFHHIVRFEEALDRAAALLDPSHQRARRSFVE